MSHVVAQLLRASLGIQPRIGLAGHESNHEALLRGEIDLYIEYTGTALRRMLNLSPVPSDETFATVRNAARLRWPVEWLPPFGFNNTYALLMRRADADRLGLRTGTGLVPHAPSMTVGAIVDFPVHPMVHQRDLVELVDNRGFFSAYHAAPVVRHEFLEQHAAIRPLIERLAGRVDNQTMARLNFEVDVQGRGPADVASAWLYEAGFLMDEVMK